MNCSFCNIAGKSKPWLLTAGLIWFAACGGSGSIQHVIIDEDAATQPAAAVVADSSRETQGLVVTELANQELKKTMHYPYLSIRFQQNDTEVEMVLDPLVTNLVLDLKRRPDGTLEVRKGDSLLTGTGRSEPLDTLNTKWHPVDEQGGRDVTDEIVRDIHLAQELFYQRKYEEALRILNRSLKKKPTAAAYALGGSIYFVHGDIKQAVAAWENALKIDPGLTEVKKLVARYKKETE